MSKYRIAFHCSMAVFALFAWTSLAPAANSVWTPARAAATVKARYSTADPTSMRVIQANIDQAKAACGCESDEHIVSLLASLEKAKHAATVSTASCKLAPRTHTRFRCTARVAGVFRAPPDYVLFTATKKLTLTVSGRRYRISEGWR